MDNGDARAGDDEFTEEDFAELVAFLHARLDPLLLTRAEHDAELAPALQAALRTISVLLGQSRAFREWDNLQGLGGTWDALLALAQAWHDHPDFRSDWDQED
ncbi:hypothetical protein ACFWSF_39820 [Streptomyces sp. NPDC058611]|uniref:hypothetical protein n=1 Tax=unclassified Streptomyces TaxID=2593676 RepID=UPI0036660D41